MLFTYQYIIELSYYGSEIVSRIMNTKVPADIYKAIKDAIKEDIEDFDITIHDPNKKGEGFLGEITFLSLVNQKSGKVFDLVVKQAFNNQNIRDLHPIRSVFLNEIFFYTEIWPTFSEFQKRISPKYQSQKLPRCLATISEENHEKLILENLKFKGFQAHNKRIPVDKEKYEFIMKEYGKFHALSFAYRAIYPENFVKLANNLIDVYSESIKKNNFPETISKFYKNCLESLQEGVDDNIIEIFKDYPELGVKQYMDSLDHETKYTVILHGDCWSNNFMFKYDENGQLADMRIIDFQLSKLGSPCCDLSYCLYSGASKEVLDNLDYFLGIYHKSLSDTLNEFGCDAEELFPFKELKKDWKQYCKLGLIMGLFIWSMKLTNDNDIKDLSDGLGDEVYIPEYNKDKYKQVTRNLILHLYENNYL